MPGQEVMCFYRRLRFVPKSLKSFTYWLYNGARWRSPKGWKVKQFKTLLSLVSHRMSAPLLIIMQGAMAVVVVITGGWLFVECQLAIMVDCLVVLTGFASLINRSCTVS